MSNIGKIELAPSVIVDIVLESINELKGVASVAEKASKSEPITLLKNIVNVGHNRYIEVELGETECVIDLGLNVYYGENIVETVREFQELVKENVEKLTGVKVKEINVKVSNIIKRNEDKNTEEVENV
ncbi:Asp23/Gls24 family envelope stress response protein [Pseudostreptobacillus hongkongensis]|uniref:Asp23/Gls24 family envelope stress response protein n=1 Tax=Pseudostreptobacillus hongkongensis TaxID=1162717 RepID=UPI00082F5641|nr:Asp23/Gls24 family envelope stress response protein [Pseudostreptobacillus hongkongensis]